MRAPALSESIQDYLKAIYQLKDADGVATISSLAERLGVSRASASAMAKKLAALDLVAARERYRAVELTRAGEQIAVEVIRHHRLLELYLAQTLGVAVENVHAEADKLEHVLSEELEARIDRALGFPTHDPHGDPIPDAKLEWPLDPLVPAVLLEDAHVVLERRICLLERVFELVPLEDVVVGARLVARAVLRVDRAADRPQCTGLALDPDHDPLRRACVVEPVEDPLGEAPPVGGSAHGARIQSPLVPTRVFDLLRSPFSFLFARTSAEERVAAYVVREHDRGRPLAEILEDPYVVNRCSPEQRARLLDRPDLIRALGKEVIEAARTNLPTT